MKLLGIEQEPEIISKCCSKDVRTYGIKLFENNTGVWCSGCGLPCTVKFKELKEKSPVDIIRLDQKWFQSKNLTFRDDGPINKGAKTRVYSVFSRFNNSLLGYVKWFPNWRQYCFFPLNSLFDKECLRQVAQFCDESTQVQKDRSKGS